MVIFSTEQALVTVDQEASSVPFRPGTVSTIMSSRAKSNRKTRSLHVENLERRELMAGNVTAGMSGDTLVIRGTSNNDVVNVSTDGAVISVSSPGRGVFFSRPATQVSNINDNMLGGTDVFQLSLSQMSFGSIKVDLGPGRGDTSTLTFASARSVELRVASETNGINGSAFFVVGSVTDRLFADFGNGNSSDTLSLGDAVFPKSVINNLQVNMGQGNDRCVLYNASIRNAQVNMGSGRDTFVLAPASSIDSGTIDGGSGDNQLVRQGRVARGVAVRNFRS
jgi:hypothetical protein